MSRTGEAKVVALIQARMSSRRLPGKVLTPIGAKTTLEMAIGRLGGAAQLDEIVVATSSEPSDDPIAAAGAEAGWAVHRGSLADVLARMSEAAELAGADAIVRVTADCPLVDASIVDALVERWRSTRADYVSNVIDPLSFPKGLNAEVVSAEALTRTHRLATEAYDREHVTTFVRARPDEFTSAGLWLDPSLPDVVLTLDTAEDLERLRVLVARVGDDPSLPQLIEEVGGGSPPLFLDAPPG